MDDDWEAEDREAAIGAATDILCLKNIDRREVARQRILEIAGRFEDLVEGREISAHFAEVRAAFLGELKSISRARYELPSLLRVSRRIKAVLPLLGFNESEIDSIITNRRILAELLRDIPEQISQIDERWAKVTGNKTLHSALFGQPKLRLARECYVEFLEFRGEEGATSGPSPYREFTELVYEVATGQRAYNKGVGLSKYTDGIARWEKRFRELDPIQIELIQVEAKIERAKLQVESLQPETIADLEEEKKRLSDQLTALADKMPNWLRPL